MPSAGWMKVDAREDGGLGVAIFELDSGIRGPTVVVLAGVHGDEPEGVLAAGQLTTEPLSLRCGRLRVVPVVNESAFHLFRRRSPLDQCDLARTFPGNRSGSPSERLAALVTRELLDGADLLIDLHTAGRDYDMPALVGYCDSAAAGTEAREAALAFGLETVWRHDEFGPGRSVTVVNAAGKPALYTECPGSGSVHAEHADAFRTGIRRVLSHLGMLLEPSPAPTIRRFVTGSGNMDLDVIRVTQRGLWVSAVSAGGEVDAGETIGTIFDPFHGALETVVAPSGGVVMMLRHRAPIEAGDFVVSLAQEDHDDGPA